MSARWTKVVELRPSSFRPSYHMKESSAHRRLAEGVKLVEFDATTGILKIHPINTLSNHSEYLGPKYEQVRTLSLETSLLDEYFEDPTWSQSLRRCRPDSSRTSPTGSGCSRTAIG